MADGPFVPRSIQSSKTSKHSVNLLDTGWDDPLAARNRVIQSVDAWNRSVYAVSFGRTDTEFWRMMTVLG